MTSERYIHQDPQRPFSGRDGQEEKHAKKEKKPPHNSGSGSPRSSLQKSTWDSHTVAEFSTVLVEHGAPGPTFPHIITSNFYSVHKGEGFPFTLLAFCQPLAYTEGPRQTPALRAAEWEPQVGRWKGIPPPFLVPGLASAIELTWLLA